MPEVTWKNVPSVHSQTHPDSYLQAFSNPFGCPVVTHRNRPFVMDLPCPHGIISISSCWLIFKSLQTYSQKGPSHRYGHGFVQTCIPELWIQSPVHIMSVSPVHIIIWELTKFLCSATTHKAKVVCQCRSMTSSTPLNSTSHTQITQHHDTGGTWEEEHLERFKAGGIPLPAYQTEPSQEYWHIRFTSGFEENYRKLLSATVCGLLENILTVTTKI